MKIPNDPKREKVAVLLLVFVGGPLFLIATNLDDQALFATSMLLVAVAIFLYSLIYIRRIPRIVVAGLVGGGLVGLVILGGGSRLAMRIVSLTGGRREVTIGGTMFLLIAGAFIGAQIGVVLAALSRVRLFRARSAAILLGLLGVLVFLGPGEIRDEIFDEGFGVWLNAPMFLSLLPTYASAALKAIRILERRLPGKERGRQLESPLVPSGVPTRR